ncbi:MAG: hypothetical protein ACI80L_002731, partial [Pseudohongiellaceae bacterium]
LIKFVTSCYTSPQIASKQLIMLPILSICVTMRPVVERESQINLGPTINPRRK